MSFVSARPVPTVADALNFRARAWGLRLRRTALELARSPFVRAHRKASHLADAPIIAEAHSKLWTHGQGDKDRAADGRQSA